MMQESVYCRLAQNSTMADAIVENIRKNKPADGLVQVLKITEKQFGKMEFIVGTKNCALEHHRTQSDKFDKIHCYKST